MSVVKVDVGGMYSAGKSTIINSLLKRLPHFKKVTMSKHCNIIHNDRSGMLRSVVDDLQVVIGNEWVTNNDGKIVYEQVVGPKSNPFLSELVFLYQAVNRYLVEKDLCKSFKKFS